jgi:general secretion pathway protein D
MKTAITRILTVACAAGLVIIASAQTSPDGTNAVPTPPLGDQAPPPPDGAPPGGPGDNGGPGGGNSSGSQGTTAIVGTPAAPKAIFDNTAEFTPPETGTNSDEIRLNFRNAPLEMVLNYLSDAAGFIIVLDTQVRGTVSVISGTPMTRDEAVDLLNSVLNKNGLAAIRDGRTLTIVDKNDAKTRDIPVKVSAEPADIPKNDEIVTQIIPIRFVEADQLVKDLSSFVSPQATIVANEAGNSIVITDTQANIRHLAEIIKAVDSSAESETEIQVFRLKYANPNDVATLLSQLFSGGSTSGNNTQSPIRFGGGPFGGFPFGGFRGFGGGAPGGGAAASTSGSSSDRIKKATTVVAVADARTSSVVVTAEKDLMEQIRGMMEKLDVSSERDQKVYVFHMNNGDPQQALSVLQSMFQSSTSTRSSSSSSSLTTSPLQERQINNASSSSSSVNSATSSSGFGGGSTGGRSSGGGAF